MTSERSARGLNVGYVQLDLEFGRREQNLTRALALAGSMQADLLVLPELVTTGYEFIDPHEVAELAEEVPGPTTEAVTRHCMEHRQHLVIGLAERVGDRLFNSALLLGPTGLLGTYRKIHLFDREKSFFSVGDLGFPVFDVLGTRLGMMVCFDWVFPESARTLALRGARLIAHAANLVLPHCPRAMPVRCLENRVFAVTANRIGTEQRAGRRLTFIGSSRVVDPDGVVLSSAPEDREDVQVVRIDPDRAASKIVGPSNDVFQDRRPDLYELR